MLTNSILIDKEERFPAKSALGMENFRTSTSVREVLNCVNSLSRYPPNTATHPTLINTKTAQKPNTTVAVFPFVSFRDPATAVKPMVSRIKIQIVKISIDPANDLITAEVSVGRNAARFVGTMPAACVGSILRRLSSSRTMSDAMVTRVATMLVAAKDHAITDSIFLKVVFA